MPFNEKEYQAAYRLANKERFKDYHKRHYAANKEKHKADCKARYEANKPKILDRQREYYKANAERYNASHRSYYLKNKAEVAEKNRAWKRANRAKVNASVRKYYQSNQNARILHRIRTRISQAFRTQATKKALKTQDMLGCSIASFRRYIESRFEPGMTWENYGPGWHLDHIVPCALFDLTKVEHQKACFHFSNYQPLFTKDNLTKGERLFHEPDCLPL